MPPLPPLPRKLARHTDDIALIPPGYGFLPARVEDLKEGGAHADLLNLCVIFEPPLKGHKYIIGADIADGLGLDRTSIDVVRQGTIERPEEQVCHFLSNTIKPREAAFIIDALGHMYCDDDGYEALAGVETNNHGMSTQDTLRLHLGYRHFYMWESSNSRGARDAREGWYTTKRTRPIVLDHFHEAVTTYDRLTGEPDLIINSSHTLSELQDFQTDGALADAAAASGAHDDCILSLAIAHYIAHRLMGGEREPLSEKRRRYHEIEARREAMAKRSGAGNSFQNMPYTADEAEDAVLAKADPLGPDDDLYDLRGVVYGGGDY